MSWGLIFCLLLVGFPAPGKRRRPRKLPRIKGYPLLRSDLIRLETLKNEDIFDEKFAADMNKQVAVYDDMFRQAEGSMRKTNGVILDATFVVQSLRRQTAEIAARHNPTFIILQTDCPQEVSIRRILNRTRDDYQSNALTEQAYMNNKKRF